MNCDFRACGRRDAAHSGNYRNIPVGRRIRHLYVKLIQTGRALTGKSDLSHHVPYPNRGLICDGRSLSQNRPVRNGGRRGPESGSIKNDGFPGLGRSREPREKSGWPEELAVDVGRGDVVVLENEEGRREGLYLGGLRIAGRAVQAQLHLHRAGSGFHRREHVHLRRADEVDKSVLAVDLDTGAVESGGKLVAVEILALPGARVSCQIRADPLAM